MPRYTSTYRLRDGEKHLPEPPAPTKTLEKISHALPLPLHLAITAASSSVAVSTAILAHIIDGPVKESWNLATSITHAAIKSFMTSNPPQGYHSMGITRLVSNVSVPKFVTGATIIEEDIHIMQDRLLSNAVRHAAGLASSIKTDGSSASLLSTSTIHKEPHRKIGGEWVIHKSLSPRPKDDTRVILYLHGGAHIFMSCRSHRGITSLMSKEADCPVYALDYRLAPENPFPKAIEDAVAAYISLLDPEYIPATATIGGRSNGVFGFKPSQIVISGDSSGGCLSMQLLLTLKALGLPMPSGAILLSPFVDNDLKGGSWRRNATSDFLSLDPRGIEWAIRCVASDPAVPNTHPIFSPIHADLSGLCPILIQAGESEVLTDDAICLHANAVAGGCRSELELYTDMFHLPNCGRSRRGIPENGHIIQSLPINPTPSSPPPIAFADTLSNLLISGNLPPMTRTSTSDSDDSTSVADSLPSTPTRNGSSSSVASIVKVGETSSKSAGEIALLISVRNGRKGLEVKEEEIHTARVAHWRLVEAKPPVSTFY
ncbi:alpha/beta hydrolase fold-domain-containing protein [Chytridium lagenaria]|nr:alpha/beta hydrolase fold-domain-containing protein [Chytridium lagenaria]